MQILLIDDEPLELFISKKFLSQLHTVEGFNTLPDALQWAGSNSFDILVSDYNLGKGVHAFDVLKALQELKGKTFKAVVLTNHVDPTIVSELISSGFDAVIEKPLSIDKFQKTIGV